MNVIHAAALIDSIWCDISRDCNTYSFDIYDVTCKTCLQAIIDEVGEAGKQAMFKWAKIEKVADLPADKYKQAVSALEKRRKK